MRPAERRIILPRLTRSQRRRRRVAAAAGSGLNNQTVPVINAQLGCPPSSNRLLPRCFPIERRAGLVSRLCARYKAPAGAGWELLATAIRMGGGRVRRLFYALFCQVSARSRPPHHRRARVQQARCGDPQGRAAFEAHRGRCRRRPCGSADPDWPQPFAGRPSAQNWMRPQRKSAFGSFGPSATWRVCPTCRSSACRLRPRKPA